MAQASGILTQDRKAKASDAIMGGLGGTLSTAELMKARKAYGDYAINADTSGGDRLTFEEFVQQVWKKQ